MDVTRKSGKSYVQEYFTRLCSQPKTEELIDAYVTDPHLKHHILTTEAAFPGYQLFAEQMVEEGDDVAIRGTFSGTHKGEFLGVPASGKHVSQPLMLFYHLSGGKIDRFSMELNLLGLLEQMKS